MWELYLLKLSLNHIISKQEGKREGTAVTEVGVADTAPEGARQRVLESLLESSASSAGLTPHIMMTLFYHSRDPDTYPYFLLPERH